MQYTIILSAINEVGVRIAQAPSAVQAVAMIERLQADGEVVRSIQSRQEGEIGIEMLRILAQEEVLELTG